MRWLDGIIDSMDMSLNELRDREKGREAWHAAVLWSQRAIYDLVTKQYKLLLEADILGLSFQDLVPPNSL